MPQIRDFLSRAARYALTRRRSGAVGGLEPASAYFFSLCSALAKGGSLRIVVIGANDGRINDPVYAFARANTGSTELYLVEPQKSLLPYLRENYGFHPRATVLNCAVGPAGSITLYSVDEAAWPRLRVPYARGWPQYRAPTGVTSGVRDHVRRWLRKYGPNGADVDSMIAEQAVECAPLPDLLARGGRDVDSIDVLQVDTEGMDDIVIYNCGIDELKPCIIHFEAENLREDRLASLTDFLQRRGYVLGACGRDILAVLPVLPAGEGTR